MSQTAKHLVAEIALQLMLLLPDLVPKFSGRWERCWYSQSFVVFVDPDHFYIMSKKDSKDIFGPLDTMIPQLLEYLDDETN